MNDKVRWLPSCDAVEAAEHIASLLTASEIPLRSGLLLADTDRPVRKVLKHLLPRVTWQSLAVPMETAGNISLPQPDREFDVVVALDTPARLSPEARMSLAREMVRVSRRLVLIAVPLGTDLQRMIEESLQKFFREASGTDHPVLTAHLDYGLPTPDEVFRWVGAEEDMDIFYGGDVLSFRRAAEHLIRIDHAGFPASLILQLTKHLLPESGRVTLELESVPMRRHRRLYLLMKRN